MTGLRVLIQSHIVGMRGRAAFGGTAGGAVAPLTTRGRLAPVELVP
jgi:hypothetical protein